MELLRIVAMLMILILHCRYDGIVSVYDGRISMSHILRFLFEALAIVGVNLFILISGYFGIHLKRQSVINLLFQIYFFGCIGLIGWMLLQGTVNVDQRFFIKALLPVSQTVWFIPNYIILMLFSPILNAFCDKYNTKQIATFVLAVYAVSYFWSTIMSGTIGGFGGYSWGWFVLLYLSGRVIRHVTDNKTYIKVYFLRMYLIFTLAIVAIALAQMHYSIGTSLLWNYDFPLIYMSSVCLFLYFVNTDIGYVKWINWLAASSFAVLLFHVAPFAKYNQVNRYIFEHYSGIPCLLLTGIAVIVYFLVAVLLDQIRIVLFKRIIK